MSDLQPQGGARATSNTPQGGVWKRSKAHDFITSFIQGAVEINCGYWDHWAALHMQ